MNYRKGPVVAYVWLAAAGLVLAGLVIFPRRDAVALAVFWFAGAVVFTANYAILDLLELYHYRPGFLPGLIPDTVLGVFLAELGWVAGWAVWLVYRLPPWVGTAIGTAVALGVEVLFRRWHIFLAHSWPLWYTAVSFPPFFLLVYWFRGWAEQRGVADKRVRTVLRISLALWWSHFTGMVIYWMMGGLVMQVHLMPTFASNQTLGAILTVGPWLGAAMLPVMAARGRERMLRLLWAAAGLLLVGQFWVAVGLWRFRAPWNLYTHTAVQLVTIYIAALCDDWIDRWAGETAGHPLRR